MLRAAGWGAKGPGSWDPAFLVSEEDKLIVEARKMGMQWHEIAQHLPERTIGSLRKQFGNSRPRPKVPPRLPPSPLLPRLKACNHSISLQSTKFALVSPVMFRHACPHCLQAKQAEGGEQKQKHLTALRK